MDELVEGVLSVGPRLAPHDWSGVIVDTGAILGDVLSVRLHVALATAETGAQSERDSNASCHVTRLRERRAVSHLLEVGGEAVHVLVVGQHGVSLGLEEVDVPDAEESQQDGGVALQRGAAEVTVLQRRDRKWFLFHTALDGRV